MRKDQINYILQIWAYKQWKYTSCEIWLIYLGYQILITAFCALSKDMEFQGAVLEKITDYKDSKEEEKLIIA